FPKIIMKPTQLLFAYRQQSVLPPMRYLYSYVQFLPPLFHNRSISYFSSITEHNSCQTSNKDGPTNSFISDREGMFSSIVSPPANSNINENKSKSAIIISSCYYVRRLIV